MASFSLAASMIWSHVTGCDMSMPAFSTKDLRYQRTWVLDQNGKTTSLSFHVAASIAPLKVPCSSSLALASCGTSARKPASANSAVNGRVERHQVDRRVLGREATGQLDPLLAGVLRAGPAW